MARSLALRDSNIINSYKCLEQVRHRWLALETGLRLVRIRVRIKDRVRVRDGVRVVRGYWLRLGNSEC